MSLALPLLCIVSLLAVAEPAQAQAYTPRSNGFDVGRGWTSADEAWFERNRRFATAGKVLTVVGRVTTMLVLSTGDRQDSPYWGMMGVAGLGELMWSGSDLRATNVLRRHGYSLRRGAGIAAVVGAVVFAPMTWIAGPIQSSRIRNLHDDLAPGDYGVRLRDRHPSGGGANVVLRW